jgi:hypothetical protein
MNLSNRQVKALARRINDDIQRSIIEYNHQIEQSEEYQNFYSANEDCRRLLELQHQYKLNDYYIKHIIQTIRAEYFKEKLKTLPDVTLDQIEDLIVLQTIESEDLVTLTTTVTNLLLKSID